uniref:Cell wall protein-like n=1 Tax=Oryza sativa subsp. japonica TaxID=39947 RepID=Q5VMQ7_ORYSJ|nr:cell wall protein-like [Oryza sativa Japonica Group]
MLLITRNARANPGRFPWPPADFSAAVLTSPVPGSLPRRRSSRPYRLARAPVGRAVSSLGVAAASPPPASPSFRAETPGGASLPATVVLPPLLRLQPPLPPRLCTGRRRHHLPRLRFAVLISGITSSSPEARRSGLLVGVQYLPVSGRLLFVASTPIDVAVSSIDVATSSSPPAAPLFRRNAVARAGLSILLVADVPSVGRSSSPAHHPAAPPSSASQRRVPRRPRLRAATVGCPRRLIAGPGRRPHRRGIRPSVKPIAFVARVSSSVLLQPRHRLRPWLRVVKPCVGRVSPSSKDRRRSRSLAVRLRRP